MSLKECLEVTTAAAFRLTKCHKWTKYLRCVTSADVVSARPLVIMFITVWTVSTWVRLQTCQSSFLPRPSSLSNDRQSWRETHRKCVNLTRDAWDLAGLRLCISVNTSMKLQITVNLKQHPAVRHSRGLLLLCTSHLCVCQLLQLLKLLSHSEHLYGFSPVWARGRCRISPPRFLAECCKRQLNQVSFV